jgi:hypothetical protein
MTLRSLSRRARNGVARFLFWWTLKPASTEAEAERKRIAKARAKHRKTAPQFDKLRSSKHAQLRRELGRA